MVSFIIVNWNGERFIEDCFNSLRTQIYKNFEIIFVDNASTDCSLDIAKGLALSYNFNAKFIELDSNTGFAQGNNEGLRYCTGEYIALLNTDTMADKNWLGNLVNSMDLHREAGICASKLIRFGENVIDSAGDGYSTFGHGFKRGEGDSPLTFLKEEYVFGACAGAALYRRIMIDQIGLFDEDFFLIHEDTDLNFRAQLSGWKCLFVPDAIVYHKVGASLRKIDTLAAYYSVRNDKLVKIKNLPLAIFSRKILSLILGEITTCLFHVSARKFKPYVRANIDVLKILPVYIRKRNEVMKLKRVTDDYIITLLTNGFNVLRFHRIKRYLSVKSI